MEPTKGKVDAKAFAWDEEELPVSLYLVPTLMKEALSLFHSCPVDTTETGVFKDVN